MPHAAPLVTLQINTVDLPCSWGILFLQLFSSDCQVHFHRWLLLCGQNLRLLLPRVHPTIDSGGLLYSRCSVFLFSSLSILLDSGFIFCMYFYRERYFCRKEPCMVYESFSYFFLFYASFVCALSSSNLPFFPGIQFSLVSELFASLVNAHASLCNFRHGWIFTDFFLQW